jgi:hypothetical protein
MVTRRASVSPMASRRIVEILSSRDQTETASSHLLLIVGQTLRQRRMKVNMKTRETRVKAIPFRSKKKSAPPLWGEALKFDLSFDLI